MRVHISIDMEGIAGVAVGADTQQGAPHYEYCRRLMTAECNAAIEGAFDAGASEVTVNDSHGTMLNLLQDDLDRRARIIRGSRKPDDMMQGVDERTDATLFVGYHAASGNGDGVLNHTMSGKSVLGVYLNDEPAGELRLNAAVAGVMGVPVALVTGDDVVCQEAKQWLGNVETVEVKEAIDKYTALSMHPHRARDEIRAATGRALARLSTRQPYRLHGPTRLRVSWNSTSAAALCAFVPGVQRTGSRTSEYVSDSYLELYRVLQVLLVLAGSVSDAAFTYD